MHFFLDVYLTMRTLHSLYFQVITTQHNFCYPPPNTNAHNHLTRETLLLLFFCNHVEPPVLCCMHWSVSLDWTFKQSMCLSNQKLDEQQSRSFFFKENEQHNEGQRHGFARERRGSDWTELEGVSRDRGRNREAGRDSQRVRLAYILSCMLGCGGGLKRQSSYIHSHRPVCAISAQRMIREGAEYRMEWHGGDLIAPAFYSGISRSRRRGMRTDRRWMITVQVCHLCKKQSGEWDTSKAHSFRLLGPSSQSVIQADIVWCSSVYCLTLRICIGVMTVVGWKGSEIEVVCLHSSATASQ